MALSPSNILTQVQTYQMSELAYLDNLFCWVNLCNKKFKDFQNLTANLGNTVTFDLPPRYTTISSLVAAFEASVQRVQTLTVDQPVSTSYAFSAEQFIFNVEQYMEKFGKSAIKEIGSKIEANVALNAISAVPVLVNEVPTGALHTESGPYRFFGDGITPINSYGQLATALAFFRNYGAAPTQTKGILSDIAVPAIVNTGLNQFVMDRNEDIAMSWQLGRFSDCDWNQSNLLATHVSGNVGNNGTILTVVSTNDPTGQNITQITCSGATPSDANAIFSGDLAQFQDGVSGQPNLRYLTFIGHVPSSNPVQIRITANAGADGSGNVVLNIFPALDASGDKNANILYNIVAGMKLKLLPSHKAGMIFSGDAMYLAMPQLPDQSPFPTANKADPDIGMSLRLTHGALFGQNQMGFINDAIWGSTVVPEYSMRLIFPLSQ